MSGHLASAEAEGATLALDGRKTEVAGSPGGFFIGPSIIDHAKSGMRAVGEEIFGPVLTVCRVGSLEEAFELGERCEYGNGAVIYTRSGRAAREFKHRFNAGMIGINVGVPGADGMVPIYGVESFVLR